VKSKFIPPIPETLVHELLQTNAKSALNWAPWIILPWPSSSSLPSGVPGGRTAAIVVAVAKIPARDVLLRADGELLDRGVCSFVRARTLASSPAPVAPPILSPCTKGRRGAAG
jgi:hypothetical protein